MRYRIASWNEIINNKQHIVQQACWSLNGPSIGAMKNNSTRTSVINKWTSTAEQSYQIDHKHRICNLVGRPISASSELHISYDHCSNVPWELWTETVQFFGQSLWLSSKVSPCYWQDLLQTHMYLLPSWSADLFELEHLHCPWRHCISQKSISQWRLPNILSACLQNWKRNSIQLELISGRHRLMRVLLQVHIKSEYLTWPLRSFKHSWACLRETESCYWQKSRDIIMACITFSGSSQSPCSAICIRLANKHLKMTLNFCQFNSVKYPWLFQMCSFWDAVERTRIVILAYSNWVLSLHTVSDSTATSLVYIRQSRWKEVSPMCDGEVLI